MNSTKKEPENRIEFVKMILEEVNKEENAFFKTSSIKLRKKVIK